MSNKNRIDANNEKIEELIGLVKQKKAMIGGPQKPFNPASYVNGTLTEVDDVYGVIKSVGLYWSSSDMASYYSVGGLSFMNNAQLKTVNLPECTIIYNNAFLSCSSLQYVSLPKCETIWTNAFGSCEALSRIELPACKTISVNAFIKSSSTSVKFDIYFADFCDVGYQSILTKSYQSNYYWSANGNPYEVLARQASSTLHSKCRVIGIQDDDTYHSSLYGDGVKWVCKNAFANMNSTFSNLNSNFKTISLPNCERIGANAFYYCKLIQSLYLPKCSYIDNYAFYSASASEFTDLTGVNATHIGAAAFYNAKYISNANWSIIEYLGRSAFGGNTIFTELPSELSNCSYLCGFAGSPVLTKAHNSFAKTICFAGCSVLSDISFPACEVLESYAFYSCPSLVLTGEEFPECRLVGSNAFASNSSMTKIVIPKCERIENHAFFNCSSLSQVVIDNCEYIASSAFYSCISLEYLDAPKCTYISSSAFMYCSNLSYINLPECLALERDAFGRCSNLASILLPKLKRLGNTSTVNPMVFSGCSFVQELDLPELEEFYARFSNTNIHTLKMSKVKVIGKGAFQYASYTYSIYIYASSVPVLTGSAYDTFRNSPFSNGSGIIYVPASLYDEFRIATNWAGLNSKNISSF